MKIAFYSGDMGKKHVSRIIELLKGHAPHHQYNHDDDSQVDLWHCMMPHSSIAFMPKASRSVVTLSDLNFITHPEIYSTFERMFLLPLYRYHCRHAAYLIAYNSVSKRRLVDSLGIDDSNVVVCSSPNSLPANDAPTSEEMLSLRSRLSLPESYILVTGEMDTMHGHTTALHALLASPHSLNIVIYGRRTTHSDVLLEAVRDAGAANRIQFIYEIASSDIAALYRMAYLMIYLPTFDSSITPIIEALHQRVPMILSDTSLNREVAAHAATYVEPYDEEALSAALKQVIYNESFRGQLIAQCWAESRRYSEEGLAEQLAQIYEAANP
ncbi:MAG: glycosyltransferase [Rikenellaceae bacterium]